MSSAAELGKRLAPDHLPDTAQLKDEAQKALKPTDEDKEAKERAAVVDNPKSKDRYTFEIDYKDGRGKQWKGEFETKILTVGEREISGLIQARKKVNSNIESFSALTIELHLMLAHLQCSLTKRPKWAENLEELYDFSIIQEIYEEVASHEAFFLGWGSNQSDSEGKRQDGDGGTP